jgi:hypothetical protein
MTRVRSPTSVTLSFFLVLALSLPWEARADTEEAENQIIIAEDSFLDVEYEMALDALRRAESTTGVTESQRLRILALRGTIHYLQEDQSSARRAYEELLSLDPEYRLPEEHPPRAVSFLEEMRGSRGGPLEIVHAVPRSFESGDPLLLRATVEGATDRHTVQVFYRVEGERNYSSTDMERESGDEFVGEIPASGPLASEQGGVVEYFILVAEGETRIANEGSPRTPLSFSILDEDGGRGSGRRQNRGTSIVGRWWFWTAIGATVALGLGLGLGLGLSGGDDIETGGADLNITFPIE